VDPGKRVIYLTFDDGPGPYTMELLDLLDSYDVQATFFVIDNSYRHLMKEITDRGHSIGIHSVSHRYRSIYTSPEAFFADLYGMQNIIEEQTGVKTWLMRFPGGSSNTVSSFNPGIMTTLTAAVEEAGFHYFDWNVDSDDAGRARAADTVFRNVTNGIVRQTASVVLQHDIHRYSVDAVERILIWGFENGYTFLPLREDSPEVHHELNN
jgi:peptidoglycan/xylan/chitin deacetylase (PgdA/CDA1 family)